MMRHIRPWEIFASLGQERDVVYRIPSHKGRESETISSLETLLLISAIRIIRAESVLELGTCLGYNAFHLARNTSAWITTVDKIDNPCIFSGTMEEQWITRIRADIFSFTPSDQFDLVFCDINYTPESLNKATEIAFYANPKVIAWHDYDHPEIPHVKPFLDHLSQSHNLIHVEDSMLVFWFKEDLR